MICKDIAERRYGVSVWDSRNNVSVKGFLCRHCFNRFIESHHNRGFFKISRLSAWAKEKRDSMRIF
jgi:hypothetical protein